MKLSANYGYKFWRLSMSNNLSGYIETNEKMMI